VRTFGVEEEFLLLSKARSELRPEADDVVEESDRSAGGGRGDVEHELMQEQAEIGSVPCATSAELRSDLVRLRSNLADAATAEGVRVLASGVSPVPVETTTTDSDRYRRMINAFALVARQQATCGQHVHVSVESRNEGVGVLDRIAPWLPVVRALAANSPYWQGADTGYASYRTILWGQWPTAGPTPPFRDAAGYDGIVAELIAAGAAVDDGMIYFDARLSANYPTVEIRVADVCTNLDDAVLVAVLGRGLVETAAASWRCGDAAPDVRPELLRAASWRAARWGLTGSLWDPTTRALATASEVLDRLVDHVGAALRASGDEDFAREQVERIGRDGTGAEQQRRAFGAGGGIDGVLDDVVARTTQW
jgi:carboxylate-amine ligase